MSIKTLDSRLVYQNRWMSVREDRIQRANGQPGIYGVVEKPDFAVIAAIENGLIYLVEQYRYPVQGRYWELPQGSCEDEALAPLELARRELREETGLVADTMKHVGRLFVAVGYSTQAYNLFFATDLRQEARNLEPEEADLVVKAFPVSEFKLMVREGVIRDATAVASLSLLSLHGLI